MKWAYALLFTCMVSGGYGQDLKINISDLGFMSGTWIQAHEWGDMEEFWGIPMGNCMVSTFRCVKVGKVIFYEFVVIGQGELVPVLKLRHFNPGSIGWEDKNNPIEFPVVALKDNQVVFESKDKTLKMTYTVIPKKEMKIILEEKNKEGAWSTTKFDFRYNEN